METKNITFIGAGRLAQAVIDKLRQESHFNQVYATTTTKQKIVDDQLVHWFHYSFDQQLPTPLQKSSFYFVSIPPSAEQYVHHMKCLADQLNSQARIIFVSSIGVYNPHGPQDEQTTITSPSSKNGKLLKEVEDYYLDKFQNCLITRPGGFLWSDVNRGPLGLIRKKGTIAIKGQAPVNLIHFQDLVEAHVAIIKDHPKERILNIVAPDHPSKSEFYTQLATHFGYSGPQFNSSGQDDKMISGNLITKVCNFEYRYQNLFIKITEDLS